jgi:hypothetical protein
MKSTNLHFFAAALLAVLGVSLLAGCASSQPKSGSAADHPQSVPTSSTMH